MDEWIDILDHKGQPTGKTCLKSEAHKNGLWHRCVHIWIYNEKAEVLLQQRVTFKETFPGFWDVSVAGHIGAGEQSEIAGIRELSEELGIEAESDQLEKIGSFSSEFDHNNQIIDREFHDVYLFKIRQENFEFKLQREEVSAVTWIPAQALALSHEIKEFQMVPYPKSYFDLVVRSIKKRTLNST